MKSLLSHERAKWLIIIVFIGIGAGFTAKNFISLPIECKPREVTHHFEETVEKLVFSGKVPLEYYFLFYLS
tara:strand:+ start:825 stop:1037 length:213 start_codon:yes stop_codon:yes gene_type:complete